MQLFYCKDIGSEGFCTLDVEESRHAVRVLRMREGDTINVTDGRGKLYRCTIVDANEKACGLTPQPPLLGGEGEKVKLHLAVAPTKNPSRMEWLVEKAVEIGVGEITLLQCDHSERTFLKTDRLEKLAVSAMKQSLHTVLPTINPPVRLREWLCSVCSEQCAVSRELNTFSPAYGGDLGNHGNGLDEILQDRSLKLEKNLHDLAPQGRRPQQCGVSIEQNTQRFIAHCEVDKPRMPLAAAMQPGRDAVVLIGPEGDFSAEEISLALEHGFQPVSLGHSRLRTETAALYAVTAFNLINDKEIRS